ncbi:MAG: argininosuccinate lyase [Pseudomonadota bacterium]|nr:argininosuccinate lyase [Pseudomonadota bacterium]
MSAENKTPKKKKKVLPKTSQIWGGRFDIGPNQIMEKINSSIDIDKRMYRQDIEASKAHTEMLVHTNIISKKDGKTISDGLEVILKEIEDNRFVFSSQHEDIHMNIEVRLTELVGNVAGKLHTARSRNDQVATDFRLWVRGALDMLDKQIQGLQKVLISIAEKNTDAIMPGYTHLQPAQPVTLGHHLLAYVEMFGRDRTRALDCKNRLNESPLGSGALAGTAFPIDRKKTAVKLGFDQPMSNSIDAVSDRDFAIEFLSFSSIASMHLSRLCEELIIWSNPAFGFISLPDSYSTGSSMLPQKRNPDAAELVRAKTGQIVGALNSLLIVMTGLPLAYSKDMQEDKEPVFNTSDTLALCIQVMTGMISEIQFNQPRMRDEAAGGMGNAVEVADWLVRSKGKPFREAHKATGLLVKMAQVKGCRLQDLSLDEMQTVDPALDIDVFSVLNLETAVTSRDSFGGTAPSKVKAACVAAKRKYL